MGARPFAGDEGTELACEIVFNDKRPQRPINSERLGFTNEVWDVLQKCWEKKPSARPSIKDISACLKHAVRTWVVDVPAFMLASKVGVENVMNMREDQARDFANKLDEVCSREIGIAFPHSSDISFQVLSQIGIGQQLGKTYLKYLWELCGVSGVLPASFMLTDGLEDIESKPFTSGGFADIYRATYNGRPVVAKVLKTTPMSELKEVQKVDGLGSGNIRIRSRPISRGLGRRS